MSLHSRLVAALVPVTALVASLASAGEYNPVQREPRASNASAELNVIVKLRAASTGSVIAKLGSGGDRALAVARRTGLAMSVGREISDSLVASRIELGGDSGDQALEKLRADPLVEYVALDYRRHPHVTNPNDTLFRGQWYLQDTEPSSVNAINAWDRELGVSGVVVAVLDTGILYDHPDLGRGDRGGKLLPGYDFVTGVLQANDGDARDADPSDPGDWINDSDRTNTAFDDCDVTGSSWHGTRVAGMVGALTNNSAGVAGLSWNSFILPVRVLGKCGGNDSDILAGMRWAAGLRVNGIPDNPTPARILNLSLGATSACQPTYRDVIQELTARKVLVVISAGNEGTMVSSPGNCPGVAAIAAIRHAGSKVGFSNLGPEVAIAAPGGNCVNINGGPCLFSLDTTSNNGTTSPGTHIFTDQINSNLGTSFSAPIVSGIAALMLSRNHNLSTAQMLARLREGAQAFPTTVADAPTIQTCHVPVNINDVQLEQCLCTTAVCGAGMADAFNSVSAADRPIAAIALPASVSAGQSARFNAASSAAACGRTVASFAWTVVSPTTNPPAITDANTSSAAVIAPSSGSVTLRLTVTDDLGRTDSADVQVESSRATTAAPASAGTAACAPAVTSGVTPGGAAPPSPSPSPSPSPAPPGSGNGGGSFDLVTLALLAVLMGVVPRMRRRRFARCI